MKKSLMKILAICAVVAICLTGTIWILLSTSGKKTDFTIGINAYAQNSAIELIQTSFETKLTALMKEKGKTVSYNRQNANADATTANTINNNFIAQRVDLIFPIGTTAAQSAKTVAATTKTPVVCGAISEPISAGLTGIDHVTGTSDALDMSLQVDLIKELFGGTFNGKIAYIYTAGEDNSIAQGNLLETAANAQGISVVKHSINTLSDLQPVFNAIKADSSIKAIYIIDNQLNSNMQQVKNLNNTITELPVVCGVQEMAAQGGIAAYGLDYATMGTAAADLAFEILINGKKPGDLPFYYPTANTLDLLVNKTIADEIGFTIPQTLLDRAKTIV